MVRPASVRGLRPWLPAAAVLLATGILCVPLLKSPGHLPLGDDTAFAAQSAQGFARALAEGVPYPRWVADANVGLGAPTFVFYSPLAYYAAGGISLAVGGDVLIGLRATLVLAALAAGLAFVAAFRGIVGEGALAAGAVLFVLAPYHVLDLYWRFAFAEYVAFAWLPLLVLFLRRTLEGRGADGVAGLGACYAGLVLTHLVTAYLAPLALAPVALVRLARSRRWGRLLPAAAGGALGLALAGAYLLPLVLELDAVRLEHVREAPYADYRRGFVLGSWDAVVGDARRLGPHVNRAAAAQGLLCVVSGALLIPALRRGRLAGGDADSEARSQAGLALWVLFLQLPLSAPLWSVLPGLATAQFPWRFQTFQALSACALLALAAALPGASRTRRSSLEVSLLTLACAVFLGTAVDCLSPRGVVFGHDWLTRPGIRHRIVHEYVPRAAPAGSELPTAPAPVARLDGPGSWSLLQWDSHERVLEVSAREPAVLHLRTFAYPGWRASVDGAPVPVRAAPPLSTLAVTVPSGDHVVRLDFGSTSGRRRGAALSLAGLLATAGLALEPRRRRSRAAG